MSNLKALKTRIQSVQSTRQITSAMYMVAAAKFRKAQKKWEAASEYQGLLRQTLSKLPKAILESYIGKLTVAAAKDHTLIVLIAADRGLCGGFNAQLFRKTHQLIAEIRQRGGAFSILPIGRKSLAFVKSYYSGEISEHTIEQLHLMRHIHVPEVVEYCKDRFEAQEASKCVVVYNRYVSPLEQVANVDQVLPVDLDMVGDQELEGCVPDALPNEVELLDRVFDQYLESAIWLAVRETFVGEFAARMSAMDNATKNSDEMIHDLKLEYNQSRQDRITRELIEIISGAEALQKG